MSEVTAEPTVTETPAAPAPPVSAVDQAVMSKDVGAFRAARTAERQGKPLEPAKAEPVAAKEDDEPLPPAASTAATTTAPPERTISKRQQQINDYERRIAELAAENAKLKTPTEPAKAASPATPAVTDDPEPDPADATKYPDGQFDRKYIKDQARWEARQEIAATVAKQREALERSRAEEGQRRQGEAWQASLAKARQRIPDFDERINPDTPLHEQVKPYVMAQEDGPEILLYLSEHPDDAARIKGLHPIAQIGELGKISARLALPPTPVAKPITSVTKPPTTLGTRTSDAMSETDAAVASGDVARFKAARLKERAAGLR